MAKGGLIRPGDARVIAKGVRRALSMPESDGVGVGRSASMVTRSGSIAIVFQNNTDSDLEPFSRSG